MFHSITALLLVLLSQYQVNCFKSLEANVWIPSFERFDDDKSFLNNIEFQKLSKSKQLPDFLKYNLNSLDSTEDDDTYLSPGDYDSLAKDSNFHEIDDLYDSIDSNEEIENSERDHESESHSSLVGGYQFVSGF